jgi:hypothetical protein
MVSVVRDALKVVSDKWNALKSLKNNTHEASGTRVLAQLCHLVRNQKLHFVVSSASRRHGAPPGRTAGSTPPRKLQGTCSEAAGPGRGERAQRRQARATGNVLRGAGPGPRHTEPLTLLIPSPWAPAYPSAQPPAWWLSWSESTGAGVPTLPQGPADFSPTRP